MTFRSGSPWSHSDYAGGSLGGFGRTLSQECVVIHATADSLEAKVP